MGLRAKKNEGTKKSQTKFFPASHTAISPQNHFHPELTPRHVLFKPLPNNTPNSRAAGGEANSLLPLSANICQEEKPGQVCQYISSRKVYPSEGAAWIKMVSLVNHRSRSGRYFLALA